MLWIALKFFVLLQSKQRFLFSSLIYICCELLSNFLYFCSRNNIHVFTAWCVLVVNCSQIFCTFAVETTIVSMRFFLPSLWIALKFFVLLQSKQRINWFYRVFSSCELLSNFLYFCSRNNFPGYNLYYLVLWIALKFFVLLQSKQLYIIYTFIICVVNCSQIFCTFAVETTSDTLLSTWFCCELLSNFLYFCSRNNFPVIEMNHIRVVNCSQIFCTFAVETTRL